MKSTSIPHLVLAAALVLLLPLEQLHCACMGSQTHAAPISSQVGHECCESTSPSGPEHQSQPEQAPHTCSCSQMAVVTLPAVIEAGVGAPTVAPLAVLTVPTVIAPVSIVTETVPALDVGNPPLPDAPGAHGLRAPPVSA